MSDFDNKSPTVKKNQKRKVESYVRDAFAALSICHNVTPVMDDGKRSL